MGKGNGKKVIGCYIPENFRVQIPQVHREGKTKGESTSVKVQTLARKQGGTGTTTCRFLEVGEENNTGFKKMRAEIGS